MILTSQQNQFQNVHSHHIVAPPNLIPSYLNPHHPQLQLAEKNSNKMQMEFIEDEYEPIYGQQTTPYSTTSQRSISTSYFNSNTLSSGQQQPSVSTTSSHYFQRIIP